MGLNRRTDLKKEVDNMSMIRDAATVLLVREAQGALQVYAQRRSQQLQAFAGVWVFPGGSVEEQDRLPHWTQLLAPFDERQATNHAVWREQNRPAIDTLDFRQRMRPLIEKRTGKTLPDDPVPDSSLDPAANLAAWVAAMRELFEETGVLLVSGAVPDRSALRSMRRQVIRGELSFHEFLLQHAMQPEPNQLRYMGRLLTPSTVKRRFDTRFFLACLPAGQEVDDHPEVTGEAVEGGWFTPREMLENVGGKFPIVPPTRYALEVISAYSTLEELWNAFCPPEEGKGEAYCGSSA